MKKIYIVLIFFTATFSFKINAQCSTPSVIPYYEGFQSITSNNQLPPCWAISSTVTCATYTAPGSGSGAAFNYSPAGSNYFYSNGVLLNAGVIYSVSAWYSTAFYATSTWSDFSLLLNTSQTALGAITLASITGPIISNVMTPLSNTFSVPNSGVYYVAVRGTSSGFGSTSYLTFDDLSITTPCTSSLNSLSVSIAANSTVICSGTSPSFTAYGANTYTWNNGATTNTINYSGGLFSNIQVIGTNTLTGCTNSASLAVTIKPSPAIFVSAPSQICLGTSATLTAFGAASYSWQSGQPTNTIVISPSVSTVYSVVGTNTSGCSANAVIPIEVKPLPILSMTSAIVSNTICNGDQDTLSVSGALTYTWTFGQNVLQGSQIIVSPNVTTNYVVTGTDANGCESQNALVLTVSGCTGINQIPQTQTQLILSPNPFQHEFLVSSGNYDLKKIIITDLSGRILLSLDTREDKLIVNTKYYSMGIYYVKVISSDRSSLFKMIKN